MDANTEVGLKQFSSLMDANTEVGNKQFSTSLMDANTEVGITKSTWGKSVIFCAKSIWRMLKLTKIEITQDSFLFAIDGLRVEGKLKPFQLTSISYVNTTVESIIESIPDDVLLEILLRLPKQDIYYVARLVCRKWNHIIRNHHLHRATYGLVYQDKRWETLFTYVREGEIKRYKLKNYKFRGLIWTSCNGLTLKKEKEGKLLTIANILTGVAFPLPSYPSQIRLTSLFSIGYAAISMTYKVFATDGVLLQKRCSILTVGVDKSWRFISTFHLSHTAVKTLSSRPFITEGFMHWHIGTQVVTLNLETEILTETPQPILLVCPEEKKTIYCFPVRRYLSLMISRGELVWEVWEMKSETQKWRKLSDMCLKGQKGRMEGLGLEQGDGIEPCGWVKYLEMLALRIRGKHHFVCFYNLVKREICSEKIFVDHGSKLLLHKYTLESPLGGKLLS